MHAFSVDTTDKYSSGLLKSLFYWVTNSKNTVYWPKILQVSEKFGKNFLLTAQLKKYKQLILLWLIINSNIRHYNSYFFPVKFSWLEAFSLSFKITDVLCVALIPVEVRGKLEVTCNFWLFTFFPA